MDRIRITGGRPLHGTIPISGAKNAALPLMIASLLTEDELTLANVPRLSDVSNLARILGNHGVDVTIAGKRNGDEVLTGQTVRLNARSIVDTTAPYELVSTMRASFWVIAPLLCSPAWAGPRCRCRAALRHRHAAGGPAPHGAGAPRRHNRHRCGLCRGLGRQGPEGRGDRFPEGDGRRHPCGADGASLADGTTVIHNAAREPEIVDLADCLIKMGARIKGHGTSTIEVTGVSRLRGAHHAVVADRIETGTYAMCVAMAGGDVLLEGAVPSCCRRRSTCWSRPAPRSPRPTRASA